MAVKAAKEGFSKQEIIDILKQNVTLFKNEPEFVEYIVNLALYLIDQAYTVSGERSGDLEDVLSQFQQARRESSSLEDLESQDKSLRLSDPVDPLELESRDDFLPDADDLDDGSPTTNKMKLKEYDAVLKAPPPPEPPEDDEPPTVPAPTLPLQEGGEAKEAEVKAESAAADLHDGEADGELELEDLSVNDEEPKTRQLRSVGILTPDAEGGLTKEKDPRDELRSPKIQVDEEKGKARVYRVVRSYSASKGGDSNCPICGTDTRGSSRCPSCGHIM